MFVVQCQCGNLSKAYASSLINKESTMCSSCGWSNQTYLEAADVEKVFNYLESTAISRNMTFTLTIEQIKTMYFANCFYCNDKPGNRLKNKSFQGLDRVNNAIGYEIENVVPCCKICNRAKSSMSLEQWKLWLARVSKQYLESDGMLV